MTAHSVFFASPFRDDTKWIRTAVAEACRELSVEFVAVDEKALPGTNIVPAIHHFAARSTLGVAVLSGLNPNVLYELGLLHALSKPTVLLADKDTLLNLPFDLRSLMTITYDATERDSLGLKQATSVAIARLMSLVDDSEFRNAIARGTASGHIVPDIPSTSLTIGTYDWDSIVAQVQKSMGLSGCARRHLGQHEDGSFKGWKMKLKCSGGSAATVIVDLNGEVIEIDVE